MQISRPCAGAILLLAIATVSFAQAPERASAQAKLDAGSMTIEYGVPSWSDRLAGEIKEGAVWRLGNNLPTTCMLDCGLMSANGPVTPGNYKLAIKYVKEGVAHLMLYQGATFYDPALPTWEIASESLKKDDAAKKAKLEIGFDGPKMHVGFGPYHAIFALNAIAVHPPVTTSFANVTAKISVLALPLEHMTMKDLRVGVAEIEQGPMKTAWGMHLSMEGDKAMLTFKNSESATVVKDKETLTGIVTRIKGMMEENPDMKEQGATFVSMFEKQIADLEMKEKALGRLQPDKMIETTVVKREMPAAKLDFSHERPEGKIVLKFGANASNAHFDIMPREFQVRRR